MLRVGMPMLEDGIFGECRLVWFIITPVRWLIDRNAACNMPEEASSERGPTGDGFSDTQTMTSDLVVSCTATQGRERPSMCQQ